jgi:hypothetical protein
MNKEVRQTRGLSNRAENARLIARRTQILREAKSALAQDDKVLIWRWK